MELRSRTVVEPWTRSRRSKTCSWKLRSLPTDGQVSVSTCILFAYITA